MKNYYQTRVAVYIMFEKDKKILLAKRCNTGYKDDFYAFVQGHVENGEKVTEAAIREAYEEVGVIIEPEDLEFGLICHNMVEIHYTDYFFACRKWNGEIKNMEPQKCENLKWFDINNLPDKVTFQVKEYIRKYLKGIKLVELP